MPSRHILPGAEHLKPLQQGSLSRLCGLYSVINAVQVGLYPQVLAKTDLQAMYVAGVRHLVRSRQLKRVIGVGMDEGAWADLALGLVEYTNQACGTAFKLEAASAGDAATREPERTLTWIRHQVRGRSPVLVFIGGALNHFTVVAGYTSERLVLFDSSGLQWIRADKIGFGEESAQRHWLSAAGVIALIDDW